jgi:hypothetical protein
MSDKQVWEEVEKGDFGVIDVLNLDDGVKTEKKISSLPEDSINLFDPIQVSHYKDNGVVQKMMSYIKYRRLDTAINRPDAFYVSLKDFTHKNRLIIPFKDDNGKIIFYQSRKVVVINLSVEWTRSIHPWTVCFYLKVHWIHSSLRTVWG